MKKLIIAILVCSMLVFTSCKSGDTPEATSTPEELQDQIDDLSSRLFAYSTFITTMQTQLRTLQDSTSAQEYEQVTEQIVSMTATIKKLNTSITSLQTQLAELQSNLQAARTTIGNTPVYINGLSVLFITNNIEIGTTGATTANSAQFAIKIVNTTKTTLTNIDITGIITSTAGISDGMAAGYPQMVDGAGLCSYAFSYNGSVICFEAYSGKTALSIPPGGSITIRPKLTIMASKDHSLPPTIFSISLTSLSYDVVTR